MVTRFIRALEAEELQEIKVTEVFIGREIIIINYHNNSSATLVEKRSLLSVVSRKSVLLWQLGIGRSQLRARDIKNKSILVAIEKVIIITIYNTLIMS